MPTTVLSALLGRGVRLETYEAVALARELLAHPGGTPTPENVRLAPDGSASCIDSRDATTVASVADLLLMLLPAGTPNVPAPLRYAIARALEVVEAPPFASLDEFSSALQRFEKGAPRDVLRDVVQRGAVASRPVVAQRLTLVERKPAPRPNPPAEAIADAPSIAIRRDADEATDPPVHWARRWALVVAAALVASFTVGFTIADGLTERRRATPLSGSPVIEAAGVVTAPAANDPAASAQVELRNELVRVPLTETPTRRLIEPTTAGAFSPAFASAGTAIFFHTGGDRDARSAIEVATAARETGGGFGIMTIVDDGSHNYHAQPSPDGRFVAFDSDRDGERGIYVANRDGSQVRRVSGPGYAAIPRWSRNGERLVYIRPEVNKPSVWNLWVQPSAGGTARRLTNYRYGQTWAASWFPDDRRIAYSHEDTLVVMDLQSGEATRYWTPVKGRLVRTPAVSPDGNKVIFQVFRHGAWLLNMDDGSMQRVLTDPTAEEFAWSPDGRRVAFHSRRDGQWGIYVLTGS